MRRFWNYSRLKDSFLGAISDRYLLNVFRVSTWITPKCSSLAHLALAFTTTIDMSSAQHVPYILLCTSFCSSLLIMTFPSTRFITGDADLWNTFYQGWRFLEGYLWNMFYNAAVPLIQEYLITLTGLPIFWSVLNNADGSYQNILEKHFVSSFFLTSRAAENLGSRSRWKVTSIGKFLVSLSTFMES